MKTAIGLLELDLLFPATSSLKEKRHILHSIKDRVRHRFNVSIAEVGYQDSIGRSHLAVITISSDRINAEKRLSNIRELVYTYTGVQVVDHTFQWL